MAGNAEPTIVCDGGLFSSANESHYPACDVADRSHGTAGRLAPPPAFRDDTIISMVEFAMNLKDHAARLLDMEPSKVDWQELCNLTIGCNDKEVIEMIDFLCEECCQHDLVGILDYLYTESTIITDAVSLHILKTIDTICKERELIR